MQVFRDKFELMPQAKVGKLIGIEADTTKLTRWVLTFHHPDLATVDDESFADSKLQQRPGPDGKPRGQPKLQIRIGDADIVYHTNVKKRQRDKQMYREKLKKQSAEQQRAAASVRWIEDGTDVRWCPPEGNKMTGHQNRLIQTVKTALLRMTSPSLVNGVSMIT
eukprot:SAG31_NODE_2083_length_6490_cov_21.969645_8_plen_164_part_00